MTKIKTWKVAVVLLALGAGFPVASLGLEELADRFGPGAGLVVSGRIWEVPRQAETLDPGVEVSPLWLFPEHGAVTRRARAIAKAVQHWGCGGLCELQAGPDYITLSYRRSF